MSVIYKEPGRWYSQPTGVTPMSCYTISISQWRHAKAQGIELVDITVKSGDQRFAPYPWALRAHKRGEMTQDEYTHHYRQKLHQLLKTEPQAFSELLRRNSPYALACYCPAGAYCHRYLLIDILKELAAHNKITFHYLGEVPRAS